MWFVFTIATTLIWGLAELFYKKGARSDEKYSHLKICVCVGAVMGIHAIFTLMTQGIGYDPVNLLVYLPVSMCYIVSMTFSFFGIRFLEESISDPVENTSGAICLILCMIFLKERISIVAGIAVAMMVVGIIGLGMIESREENERKKLGRKLAVISFMMPFCYAILDALGTFLDIYYLDVSTSPLLGVTETNIENVANTTYELTFAICAVAIVFFLRTKGERFGTIADQWDKIIAAVCETGGQFTYVFAMSGNGAIAAPIISSVCVVSLLLSRMVLKERLSRRQYMCLTVIILGILTLAVAEGE